MIKNFPQLGEVLAEFENRISKLENSQPYGKEEQEQPRPVEVIDHTPHIHRYTEVIPKKAEELYT